MSEGEGNTHWLTSAGGWAASLGLVMIVIENAIGTGDSSLVLHAAALESSV